MKRITIVFLLAFSMCICAMSAAAEEAKDLQIETMAEIEVEQVNSEGKKTTVRKPAAKVVPGDIVIYTNSYKVFGAKPLDNIVFTNPIPKHTEYVAGSAAGEDTEITFSADNGVTFDQPENLKYVSSAGWERQALPTEYTHIRWTMTKQLLPGDKGSVTFRVKLK